MGEARSLRRRAELGLVPVDDVLAKSGEHLLEHYDGMRNNLPNSSLKRLARKRMTKTENFPKIAIPLSLSTGYMKM